MAIWFSFSFIASYILVICSLASRANIATTGQMSTSTQVHTCIKLPLSPHTCTCPFGDFERYTKWISGQNGTKTLEKGCLQEIFPAHQSWCKLNSHDET